MRVGLAVPRRPIRGTFPTCCAAAGSGACPAKRRAAVRMIRATALVRDDVVRILHLPTDPLPGG
jgi:hypothetical protein